MFKMVFGDAEYICALFSTHSFKTKKLNLSNCVLKQHYSGSFLNILSLVAAVCCGLWFYALTYLLLLLLVLCKLLIMT